MKNLILIVGVASLFLLISCSDDNYTDNSINRSSKSELIMPNANNEKYLVKFASILSKATYERKDVREFLKDESLKQFDKNYDVLYYLIKDKKINDESFRDILISLSSEKEIEEIETNVQLLNILIPEIAFFNIDPSNLDVNDEEIPVAISKNDKTSLFLNGEEEVSLEKGEIPNFHVFVVNENSRVMIASNQSINTKSANNKSIIFKSPNFDGGLEKTKEQTRSIFVNEWIIGRKAINAYKYFNTDDGSNYQMAFQRDNIYYGITPENKTGNLNRSVSEYIAFIEINPRSYFKIADQVNTGSNNDDPIIKDSQTSQKKRELTENELLDRLWTKGAYDFRFEIILSTSQHPQIVYIPLKPNEIWNFNIEHSYRHSTFFRRSKHTYRIDPNKFTSKRVFLTPDKISFGKWNLAEESIYRYVNILEEDESIEKTYTTEYEVTRVNSNRFKGDLKVDIGLGSGSDKISGGAEYESNNSNTIKEKKVVTIIRKEESDNLGSVRIYFYDPLIEGTKKDWFMGDLIYKIHTYNTGSVIFGLSVQ